MHAPLEEHGEKVAQRCDETSWGHRQAQQQVKT
ncbi:hypothetical protein VTJ04DRAFT_2911 [Mycothermus thermophilus]